MSYTVSTFTHALDLGENTNTEDALWTVLLCTIYMLCIVLHDVCVLAVYSPPANLLECLYCIIRLWTCYVQCTVGYNNFNNLVLQTLWWLPNKILRHIHKKRFSVFLSRFLRICNQSVQKKLKRTKKNFVLRTSIWGSKNTEFDADFESDEKVLKKCTQKRLLAKTWRKYALFPLLLMFVKLVLLVTFFWCNYLQLFQRIRNQREILRKKQLKKSKNLIL